MKEFNYFAPGSVEEALELMKEYEGKYTILNGGTDVMIRLRERLINPEAVIDIKRIPGLKEITFSKKDGLYIGACVTCKEISESEIVKENYPFYAQAASVLGSQLVRGRATSVGNVINASPLADTVTPLVACDAKLVVVGPEGQREVSLVSWAGESQEERSPAARSSSSCVRSASSRRGGHRPPRSPMWKARRLYSPSLTAVRR